MSEENDTTRKPTIDSGRVRVENHCLFHLTREKKTVCNYFCKKEMKGRVLTRKWGRGTQRYDANFGASIKNEERKKVVYRVEEVGRPPAS